MGIIREPQNVDFSGESKQWTKEELRDFRILMAQLKAKKSTVNKEGDAIKLSRSSVPNKRSTARKKRELA